MGRPNKTKAILKLLKQNEPQNTSFGNFTLPNQSGDHSRGHVRDTPQENLDIVNKAYADAVQPTATASGCVAFDHGTAATDMVVNVCYGTGAAPAANTTTEGALYITYTA